MKNHKFYAVVVASLTSPISIHDDYDEALNEAKRIATKKEETAFVLTATTRVDTRVMHECTTI